MRKFLLICSAVALFYGDFAIGMDDDITIDELTQKFENLTLEDNDNMDVDDSSSHKDAQPNYLEFETSH